jgi:G3E family GTPase
MQGTLTLPLLLLLLLLLLMSGLANPGPIVSSFYMDQDLPDRVRLDGIVTVVRGRVLLVVTGDYW